MSVVGILHSSPLTKMIEQTLERAERGELFAVAIIEDDGEDPQYKIAGFTDGFRATGLAEGLKRALADMAAGDSPDEAA